MSPPRCPVCPVRDVYFLFAVMKRAILCIILLTGFCSCLHEYHFVNEKKTWSDAQSYCRDAYTDLATIDSMGDMQELITSVGVVYEGEVWIGLQDLDWAWDWSLGDLRYYRLGEYIFRVWSSGEPNNVRATNLLCTAMLGGYWYDVFCNETYTFVCYDNPTRNPTLPANSTANYVYMNTVASWYTAQGFCRKYYTDLASIRNETELALITQLIPPSQMVLIGLYRLVWNLWSDKSLSTFRYWAAGRPLVNTGNCAASVINATLAGKWVENPCDIKLDFVCYNTKKQVFILKVTAVKPSVDLNVPDVLETIKTFMEERMTAMGVLKDIRMSWVKLPGKNIFRKEEETANLT